ncbi:hypothetical protein SAMN04490202_0156 [Pseudomonas reinekei]|uniref:Uncharacterized protein n=1 Tax=Pseudomonas reinekei TaxID=395598 RepID=A0A1H0HM33_PSERE|nr:hypothetical protein SAMN04490202_0156 [Pseudomonas reinekei]
MASDRSALPRQPGLFRLRHRQAINHMHAIPRHIRVVFGLGCHFRQLAGVDFPTGLWMQVHHADGQRKQREFLAHALAVGGDEAAGFEVFGAVEAAALALKHLRLPDNSRLQ